MYRKRLLSMFAALLVGLSAGPAAALDVSDAPSVVQDVAAVTVQVSREVAKGGPDDPIIDDGIEGVGHLLLAIDEESQSVTVGVSIEPLGVDETITLGGADDEDPADEDAANEADVAAAEERADMTDQKARAAAEATDAASHRPALAAGNLPENVSGQVDSGTGVTSSVRPAATTSGAGNQAAGELPEVPQNAWLQLMGVVMLASTSTAWSIAKRQGLA